MIIENIRRWFAWAPVKLTAGGTAWLRVVTEFVRLKTVQTVRVAR